MLLNPDKTYKANGVTIKEFLLTKHNPNNIAMPTEKLPTKPLGVTIHNTDWINVSSITTPAEQYTRATYYGNMKDVRVHFYVDDKCAWQNLPLTLCGWHAADGRGNGNMKTIAIECIMSSKYNSTDKKSEENAAKLIAYLLNQYNLDINHLYTHTHWLNVCDGKIGTIEQLNIMKNSYKNCPAYILPHWSTFRAKVQSELDKLKGTTTQSTTQPTTSALYRIRKTWEDSKSQIGAYSTFENAKAACKVGYSVFNENGKNLYTNAGTTSAVSPSSTTISTSNTKPDIYYRVYTNGKWLSEVKNFNNSNDEGYAGIEKQAIKGLAAKSSKGNLKYRVHVVGGGWLGWIDQYNVNDWSKGCAGAKTKNIDGIQFNLNGISDYTIKYRVSLTNSSTYLDWVTGYNNTTGYAGIFGKTIDKVQIEIVKK